MAATALTGEHPQDVLQRLHAWQAAQKPAALIIVTGTEGGAVRACGALLAVSEQDHLGYISGGCIDADVVLQARQALIDGQARSLRYGAGSPFVDLPLPCGGAIEVLILPQTDPAQVARASTTLKARREVRVQVTAEQGFTVLEAGTRASGARFTYMPKLRLRIAGRGADALALARISAATGFQTRLQLLDTEDADLAVASELDEIEMLDSPNALPALQDDAWTAFVLLFHDQDWERVLLQQALAGPAFYIGAVGSRRTHLKRCEMLKAAGLSARQIGRIHGPIGLVPSLRDASLLAISILAEIVEAQAAMTVSRQSSTALILLAAGASSRFEAGDKLLAPLSGETVLTRAARLRTEVSHHRALAICAPDQSKRQALLTELGWDIVINPDAALGQSTSLKCALNEVQADDAIDQVLILLGDMPNLPVAHLHKLLAAAEGADSHAVMSDVEGVLSPPAVFKRSTFADLAEITGDRGAKTVFKRLRSGAITLPLKASEAIDIDQVADLQRALEMDHA